MSRESIAKRIGARLRGLRLQAKLTQAQLGRQAGGIAAAEISKFENARRAPSLETLERLAQALDVPLRDLLDVDGPLEGNADLIELFVRLREEPPEQLRRIIAVVDALLDAEQGPR